MSLQDIENCLCDFIEATVHEVLHLRGIYSAELFQRQRLFNIAVRKSRHPKLTDYIHGVVQSIRVRPVSFHTSALRFSVIGWGGPE